ncbi:RagB/SusD family nutrient uptake outer membrane protein [Flavobacteriaceae bacterium 3-367]
MKKVITLICSCVALLACEEDFLEIPLEDATPAEEFFVTQEHALEAVNQMYAYQIEWFTSGFPYTGVLQIPSDDSDKGSNPGDAAFLNDFNNFTFNSSAFLFDNYWTGQFRGINYANQVLANVPNISMDESLKTRLLAEARFFRGYHYFNLVRAFGGVPLYETLPEDGIYNIPRNSADEVYALVIADLTQAAEGLPVSYSGADVGRATQGAAKGFLAKAYMYRGDWAQVLSLTEEVKGLGYDLFPDYYQFFRPQNEYNVESIFEVQSTADGNCQADSQYGQHQGVRGQFGWGFNSPSEDLVNAYEPGDLRMDATILFVGETTPEGDLITAGNNPDNPIRYNQKAYIPEVDHRRNNCRQNADANLKILRFADILLMNAEANNELGNAAAALQSLNRIRTRAGLADSNTADQAALRMEIWRERRVELALEGDRFLDLVRQGRAGEVLRAHGTQFTDGVHELFPIPANQISLSNGVLEQNPGY